MPEFNTLSTSRACKSCWRAAISDAQHISLLSSSLSLQESEIKPKLLDTQYRMHPAIAGFPSEMFYEGKLRSGIKAASRPAPKGKSSPKGSF